MVKAIEMFRHGEAPAPIGDGELVRAVGLHRVWARADVVTAG